MYKLLSTFSFVIIGLFLGCQSNGFNTDKTAEPVTTVGENFIFIKSESIYNDLYRRGQKREKTIGSPFEIVDVWSSEQDDKKYLHIEVIHKKACDAQFEIVWDGRVAESYPLQTWLLVKLDAGDCPDLDHVTTDTLSVDLYKFFGDKKYLADERVIFHVYNISTNRSTDSDSSTSK